MIKNIGKQALFLETASVQSVAETDRKTINYLLAPALPQRYSCYSAGKIIAEKILGELND